MQSQTVLESNQNPVTNDYQIIQCLFVTFGMITNFQVNLHDESDFKTLFLTAVNECIVKF